MVDLATEEKLKKMFHWSYGPLSLFMGLCATIGDIITGLYSPLTYIAIGFFFGMGLLQVTWYFKTKKIISR
jgi:hypothetical protein